MASDFDATPKDVISACEAIHQDVLRVTPDAIIRRYPVKVRWR